MKGREMWGTNVLFEKKNMVDNGTPNKRRNNQCFGSEFILFSGCASLLRPPRERPTVSSRASQRLLCVRVHLKPIRHTGVDANRKTRWWLTGKREAKQRPSHDGRSGRYLLRKWPRRQTTVHQKNRSTMKRSFLFVTICWQFRISHI